MEWVQVNYDVIWTSSWALSIVCIEAGANGSQDLDAELWEGVFDRDVRDSGAILVAAGTPTGRTADSFTNYGSRMDLHARGAAIGGSWSGASLTTVCVPPLSEGGRCLEAARERSTGAVSVGTRLLREGRVSRSKLGGVVDHRRRGV